jgi:hypothetical protein
MNLFVSKLEVGVQDLSKFVFSGDKIYDLKYAKIKAATFSFTLTLGRLRAWGIIKKIESLFLKGRTAAF